MTVKKHLELVNFAPLAFISRVLNALMNSGTMMINNLKILSILGILEGISYLMLLGICMPLKYGLDIPEPTSLVGMVHGLLFIAYCAWVIIVSNEHKWSHVKTLWALLASVLPFGTFIADKRIFRQYA